MRLWRLTISLVAALVGQATAQGNEKLSISFRDPARPGTVKVNSLMGSISVKAHTAKDVVVEIDGKPPAEKEPELPEPARGLRRLHAAGASISLEEENNVVTISMGWRARSENVTVLVPLKTSLKLNCVNGKLLSVEGVDGEMELSATNGGIRLVDVSGSVVAHAMNGKIQANFKRVDESKPMSFSSYNSSIDVTLPATTKAILKMQTQNGDVFTDFDVQMAPNSVSKQEGESSREGRRRIRYESVSMGKINGGGPEMSFKNFNGNIYIRKGN